MYANWASTEPNNNNVENCAACQPIAAAAGWNDIDCALNEMSAIIECVMRGDTAALIRILSWLICRVDFRNEEESVR